MDEPLVPPHILCSPRFRLFMLQMRPRRQIVPGSIALFVLRMPQRGRDSLLYHLFFSKRYRSHNDFYQPS